MTQTNCLGFQAAKMTILNSLSSSYICVLWSPQRLLLHCMLGSQPSDKVFLLCSLNEFSVPRGDISLAVADVVGARYTKTKSRCDAVLLSRVPSSFKDDTISFCYLHLAPDLSKRSEKLREFFSPSRMLTGSSSHAWSASRVDG